MTISAMLLIAVAAAFQASARAVGVNEDAFAATQIARAAVDRLSTEIRCADAVDVASSGSVLRIIRPAAQRERAEAYREFSYDAGGHRLLQQIIHVDGAAGPETTLAEKVTACRFAGAYADERHDQPARVDLSIRCSTGRASITLNASAAPRRTMP